MHIYLILLEKLGKNTEDIKRAVLDKNLGFEFDKKIIKVQGGNIKRLGTYTASIRLHRDVINEITFDVIKSQE